jgi:hypothetical protein
MRPRVALPAASAPARTGPPVRPAAATHQPHASRIPTSPPSLNAHAPLQAAKSLGSTLRAFQPAIKEVVEVRACAGWSEPARLAHSAPRVVHPA